MIHLISVQSDCFRIAEEFKFMQCAPVPRIGERYIDRSGMYWKVIKVSTRYVDREDDYSGCVSYVTISNV